jgi:CBS domain-containing protein
MGGQVVALGLILVGISTFFAGQWVNGLWLAFIGWFLNSAAAGAYQQMMLREYLAGVTARDVMLTDCPAVSRSLTLQELVNDYILKTARRCFPVTEDGQVSGIIILQDVAALPQEQWPTTAVERAMTPFEKTRKVRPDQDLWSVMELMAAEDINQVLVVEDGRLLGMVSRDRILAYLTMRAELGLSVPMHPAQQSGETAARVLGARRARGA